MSEDKKYVTKDSGHRQVFKTGAQRDRQEGKGRYDLIPSVAIKRLADIFERGALKYSARNYELGMPLSRFIDSALRHLFQYLEGRRDEDHLGQAFWNLSACIHTETMINRGLLPQELNDLPTHYVEDSISPPSDGVWLTDLGDLDVQHDVEPEPEEESEPVPLPPQPPFYHKFLLEQKVKTKPLGLAGVVVNFHETLRNIYYVKLLQFASVSPSMFHESELEIANG